MKLTTRDIGPYTERRQAQPVLLIYGPDHGLVKERAQIMAKYVATDLNDPFNVARLTGDQVASDTARFFDETSAMSMMGGDRLVMIENAGDALSVPLKTYLGAPVPGTFVILVAGDLPAKSPLRKLCETANNAGALPCYVQDSGDVQKYITNAVRTAGLTIERDALIFLGDVIGGDHQQIRGEVEKLLTYMGVGSNGTAPTTKAITYDDAVACSGAMGNATFDTMIDALLLGQTAVAMTQFKRLEDDGIPAIAILRGLLNHTRKIQATHIRVSNGERLDEILDSRDAPVFFKRKAAFGTQMRKWPLPRLITLMNDILSCELKIKSGIDPDAAVPQTLLALSARANKAA